MEKCVSACWEHGLARYFNVIFVLYCFFVYFDALRFGDSELQRLLPNLNALVAASKCMWAVKPCINKIFQFLTEGAS